MINRDSFLSQIEANFRVHSVCGLLGPRQVGKTTLARMFIEKHGEEVRFFDLENIRDLARLENPMLVLSKDSHKLVVIDEIQMRPDLFPVIRVLVDDPVIKRRFLILGSASRDLIRQSSETLAGRIGYIELPPFSIDEISDEEGLLLRGGFPSSYLSGSDQESFLWRENYVRTFLERDIPNLGFNIPPQQLRRFWMMLAHYHGQIFNASEIAKSMGISGHLCRKYLDLLSGTFMIRVLLPWFENIKKRQVRSPKIYFRDSGILNLLLNIRTYEELDTNPKLGCIWEGFALEEVARRYNIYSGECFFWGTHADAELDLFVIRGSRRIGFEFKYSDAPRTTKSMRMAIADLKLDHLYVVYPGEQSFDLDDIITASPLTLLPKTL